VSPGDDGGRPRQEAPSNVVNTDSHILPRRRHRLLEFEFESRYCVRVRGDNARALIMEVTGGKVPCWSSKARAFTIGERRARDLVGLAEVRGYAVTITGPRAGTVQDGKLATAVASSSPEREAPLW
jgi:hypothetical protein